MTPTELRALHAKTTRSFESSGAAIWGISLWNARVRLFNADFHSPTNGIDQTANAAFIAAAHEHFPSLLDDRDELYRLKGVSEEEVARIIDPSSFSETLPNRYKARQREAREKARAILALRSSGPTEETQRTLQEATKLDTTLRDVLTKFPTPAPDTFDRERLGKLVRHVWIKWARRQPDPKPSWLVPYEDLSEPDKEVDRQIGANIAQDIYGRILVAAEGALRGSDSDVEKPTPGASSAPLAEDPTAGYGRSYGPACLLCGRENRDPRPWHTPSHTCPDCEDREYRQQDGEI